MGEQDAESPGLGAFEEALGLKKKKKAIERVSWGCGSFRLHTCQARVAHSPWDIFHSLSYSTSVLAGLTQMITTDDSN